MDINTLVETVCTLLSSYQYTALLGWMFSVAILLGGLLFHKNFSQFFLAVFVSGVFIILEETGRILYFSSVGEVITFMPIVMAVIDSIIFTLGIYVGYTVSGKARERVKNGK